MKQETGSNTPKQRAIVSIRITSSGDNFTQLPHPTEGEVTLLCESTKAMLVPTELLEHRSLEGHLLAAGIAVDPQSEEVEIINYDHDITALIVVPTTLLAQIAETYGNRAHLSTPLLAPSPARGNTLLVHLSEDCGVLTLTLHGGSKLLFAELFEIGSITDVLYWIIQLDAEYNLNRYIIYVEGGDKGGCKVRETKDLLSKYFNRIM